MPLFTGTFTCRLPQYRPLYMPGALLQQFTGKAPHPPGGIAVHLLPGTEPRTVAMYLAADGVPAPANSVPARVMRSGLRLPDEMLEVLSTESDTVICIGCGTHVEIWPVELWEFVYNQQAPDLL